MRELSVAKAENYDKPSTKPSTKEQKQVKRKDLLLLLLLLLSHEGRMLRFIKSY